MPSFSSKRDAWGTIRGYVYQANLTVQRWLDLQPDQILELERGEDIDLITVALADPGVELGRLMEQVRVREQSVTLRTPGAVGALAHAVEQLQSNPSLSFVFRYATTASIGLEIPPLFQNDSAPALDVWEELRQGVYPAENAEDSLITLSTHLQNRPRPQKIGEPTWDAFRSYLEQGPTAMATLVKLFEWSTGRPQLDDLTSEIRERLVADGYAATGPAAQTLHDRLFFHVFRLLSQFGIKRLTRDDLHAQLKLPQLSHDEEAALERISSLISDLQERVAALEIETELNRHAIRNVEADVRVLVAKNVHTLGDEHKALASRILRRGVLGARELVEAVDHLEEAGDFNKAGALFAVALSSLRDAGSAVGTGQMLDVWWKTSIPYQMELKLRLHIRALQISIALQRDLEHTYLVQDAWRLSTDATEAEAWAILSLALHLPSGVEDYLITGLRLLRQHRLEKEDDLEGRVPPELILFSHVEELDSRDRIDAWLDVVQSMTEEERITAFSAPVADSACMVIAERLWLQEAEKPSRQEWVRVLQELRYITQRAKELKLELLNACAVRVQVIVLNDYGGGVDRARRIADEELSVVASASSVFVIEECVGQQYLIRGNRDEAKLRLEHALVQSTAQFPYRRVLALLSLSRITASQDVWTAYQQTKDAVRVARETEEVPEIELIRALGETCVAAWLAGDNAGAFDALDEAAERILSVRDDSDRWKDLFMAVGHTSGYLSSLLYRGAPPGETDSGEPYAPPQRGMFAASIAAPKAIYFEAAYLGALPIQLVWFAEAVNSHERAAYWGARGLEIARDTNHQASLAVLDYQALPVFVQGNRYLDAVHAAIEGTELMQALEETHLPELRPLDMRIDIEAVLGPKPSERWDRVERLASTICLAPIALRLGTLWFEDRDLCILAAKDVAAVCLDLALTASDAQLWRTAADLLLHVFVQNSPLIDLERRCRTGIAAEQTGLLFICNLGLTLNDDISMESARRIHNYLLAFTQDSLGSLSEIEKRLLAPFLEVYWRDAFLRKRLLFRVPELVSRELESALTTSPNLRARAILTAIGYGV